MLSAAYGSQRYPVGGKTLAEAGKLIEDHLREIVVSPSVLVTYAGHDSDVVAPDQPVSLPVAQRPRFGAGRGFPPFAGTIRPGDILEFDIEGGLPAVENIPPQRTVEPDGTIPLTRVYDFKRIKLAGKTLVEAGKALEETLSGYTKEPPKILVTYAGHDPDVISANGEGLPQDLPPEFFAGDNAGLKELQA